MSIERFYTESFTRYTFTEGASFPHDKTWTAGATFNGALATISSREQWNDGTLAAISSHIILTATSVTMNKEDRIYYGSRIFDVVGPPDPIPLRPGHHQEIYVKEV